MQSDCSPSWNPAVNFLQCHT